MGEILKKSFLRGILVKCINFFSDAFKQSAFRKIISAVSFFFAVSGTKAVIKRYFDKKPLFFNSVFYRGIKFIGKHAEKAVDKINSAVSELYNESFLKKVFDFYKSEDTNDKLAAAGIFLMIVSLSFLVFSVVFNKNGETRIFMSWALFFIGILVVYAGRSFEIVKQSFTYKAVKYIIELVKM